MDNFFIILFLLSPVFLIAGLAKPSLFSKMFKRELSRKKIALSTIGIGLASLILFAITTDIPEATEEVQETKQEDSQVAGTSDEKEEKLYLVTRVIDGDTIEIEGGQKVRYIGIDTPETVDPNEPEGCVGKKASDKNKELVEGKKVRLEKDVSETDKYGRLLRYVYIGDIFVNEYLVKEGYASSVSYPPDVKYQDKFREAEEQAREEEKGLWGDVCNIPTSTVKPTIISTPRPVTISTPKPTTKASYNTPAPTTNVTPLVPQAGESYICNCKKTCSQMVSCDEAYYQLNTCGCSVRDGDKDGVPCENICPGG